MTHVVALVGVRFCPSLQATVGKFPFGFWELGQKALWWGWSLSPSAVGAWVFRTSSTLLPLSTNLNSICKKFGGSRKQIWDQAKMFKWISWQQSKANKPQDWEMAQVEGRASLEVGGREKWQLSGRGFYRAILHRPLGISFALFPSELKKFF